MVFEGGEGGRGAQVNPTNVTLKRAGFVCHFEMLGLRIQNEGGKKVVFAEGKYGWSDVI